MTKSSVRDQRFVAPSSGSLDEALERLVREGTLDAAQADAVRRGAQGANLPTAAPVVVAPVAVAPVPAVPKMAQWRERLLEAAAYLGAGLVGASLLTLVAQSWEDMTWTGRVLTLEALGLVALAAGLIVALAVGAGRHGLGDAAQAPRRRVASVLLTLGSVVIGAGVAVALHDSDYALVSASVVAGILLLGVQFVAPSALSELAMFGALVAFVGSMVTQVLWPVPPADPALENGSFAEDYVAPAVAQDYALPLALASTGLIWAGLVARRLTLPMVATAAGLLVTLQFMVPFAGNESTRVAGLVTLGVGTLLGMVGYLWTRMWPWLAFTILTVTSFVFVLVQDSLGAPFAFLVAGLVLLGSAFAGWRWGNRDHTDSGQPGGTSGDHPRLVAPQ